MVLDNSPACVSCSLVVKNLALSLKYETSSHCKAKNWDKGLKTWLIFCPVFQWEFGQMTSMSLCPNGVKWKTKETVYFSSPMSPGGFLLKRSWFIQPMLSTFKQGGEMGSHQLLIFKKWFKKVVQTFESVSNRCKYRKFHKKL